MAAWESQPKRIIGEEGLDNTRRACKLTMGKAVGYRRADGPMERRARDHVVLKPRARAVKAVAVFVKRVMHHKKAFVRQFCKKDIQI